MNSGLSIPRDEYRPILFRRATHNVDGEHVPRLRHGQDDRFMMLAWQRYGHIVHMAESSRGMSLDELFYHYYSYARQESEDYPDFQNMLDELQGAIQWGFMEVIGLPRDWHQKGPSDV